MAEDICRRLRFSNDDTEQVLALVDNHMRFADITRMKESTLKRFLRLPRFEEHLDMHRMDCQSSHGDLSLYNFAKEKLASTPPEAIRPALLEWRCPHCGGLRSGARVQGNFVRS